MNPAAQRLILTLTCVGLLLVLLYSGFGRDPRYISSPLLGRAAPDFSLDLFGGGTVRLSELRGKTVMVDFWASWCLPCREEARDLEAAWKRQGDDVVFLGVNVQDEEEDALKFIEEFGVSFPNGRDRGGRVAVDYGVWGIPEAFFVSPRGRITYKHVGPIPRSVLTAKLDQARQDRVSPEGRGGEHQTIR